MRIVVLAGGLSTERDVSISSGIKVASALREKGNEVVLLDVFMGYEENFCDIDALFKHNYSFTDSLGVGTEIPDIKTVKENRLDKSSRFIGMNVIEICAEADITYLALHGGEGENGQIQATLDLFGIKYTGSGYLGSALAMNKALTKSTYSEQSYNSCGQSLQVSPRRRGLELLSMRCKAMLGRFKRRHYKGRKQSGVFRVCKRGFQI